MMVEQFDFEADGVTRAIATARTAASLRDEKKPNLTRDDLWSACRELSRKQYA